MTKKGRNILLAAAAVLAVAGLFTAFGQKETEKTVITASANNWDSQNLHNAIAKLVVEHAYDGYEFGTSAASSTMNWQSLLAGVHYFRVSGTKPFSFYDLRRRPLLRPPRHIFL